MISYGPINFCDFCHSVTLVTHIPHPLWSNQVVVVVVLVVVIVVHHHHVQKAK
jgi:hypothetical protein